MEQVYLPGKIRDCIQNLMKSRKVTQAELAARIGCSESSLSRFISGKTDKLGDENIIRIARVFNVSTDFLLGEVDVSGRLNCDISELGLSVQSVTKEFGNDLAASRELISQAVKKIYAELTKGQKKPNRKIAAEQIGEAVAQSVSHLPVIDTEAVKQMFLAMTGTVQNHENRPENQ